MQHIHIIKIEQCPSLSGRSELTYQVGKDDQAGIHVRVTQNSSSGQFNRDWVSLDLVEQLLTSVPEGKPLTSTAIRSAYFGKSTNSPPFLFAALKAEGLVTPHEDKDQGYLLGDFSAFRASVSELPELAIDEPAAESTPPVTKPKRRKARH